MMPNYIFLCVCEWEIMTNLLVHAALTQTHTLVGNCTTWSPWQQVSPVLFSDENGLNFDLVIV